MSTNKLKLLILSAREELAKIPDKGKGMNICINNALAYMDGALKELGD